MFDRVRGKKKKCLEAWEAKKDVDRKSATVEEANKKQRKNVLGVKCGKKVFENVRGKQKRMSRRIRSEEVLKKGCKKGICKKKDAEKERFRK